MTVVAKYSISKSIHSFNFIKTILLHIFLHRLSIYYDIWTIYYFGPIICRKIYIECYDKETTSAFFEAKSHKNDQLTRVHLKLNYIKTLT